MRLPGFFSLFMSLSALGVAQVKPAVSPVDFEGLEEVLKTELIPMSTVIDQIKARGIDFDLSPKLAALLTAATAGKRTPSEMAAVISTSLDNCQKCHARL